METFIILLPTGSMLCCPLNHYIFNQGVSAVKEVTFGIIIIETL